MVNNRKQQPGVATSLNALHAGNNINTLRPRQNGRHVPDDIFKCIFLTENVCISIKISLKFVRKGPIKNIPTLIQTRWVDGTPTTEVTPVTIW